MSEPRYDEVDYDQPLPEGRIRELAEGRANPWPIDSQILAREVLALRATVAELTADKERLDWLDAQRPLDVLMGSDGVSIWHDDSDKPIGRGDYVRAAIDAALDALCPEEGENLDPLPPCKPWPPYMDPTGFVPHSPGGEDA